MKSVVYWEYRHAEAEDDEEEEELSTHLNTSDIGPYLEASEDSPTVQYIGRGGGFHDVGAAQGNRPVAERRLLYYFEMTVEDSGRRDKVSIGFTDERFDRTRQPGWEPDTYGYHGDDGKMFNDSGFGIPFGPTYTNGDTVGAGINNASQDVFFTDSIVKNIVYYLSLDVQYAERMENSLVRSQRIFKGPYFLLLVFIAKMSGWSSILGKIISSLIFSNWLKTCLNKFVT